MRAVAQLADSVYAPCVQGLSIDLADDLAWKSSFEKGTTGAVNQIGSMLSRFPKLTTVWILNFPTSQGPCSTADWSGFRSEMATSLATNWIAAIKQFSPPQLTQLNLMFEGISQMKKFAAQLNTAQPEGPPDGWFQGCMIEEASGPLAKRAPHDVRSIFSVMPATATNRQFSINGSMGRNNPYRSYRLMQYVPAAQQITSLHLSNVNLDGDVLERIILSNASSLQSIELYAVTLRSTYWASIFVIIQECCEQLETLQVGCLGYLLPISSILDKLSEEEREDKIARDAGDLGFLYQTVAERRWNKGMDPIEPRLLCSACESERGASQPTREFEDALKSIEARKGEEKSVGESDPDPMAITNQNWSDMLWLHAQLWEG